MLLSLRRSVIKKQACAITAPDACTKCTDDLLLDTARYSLPLQQSNGRLSSVANTVWAKTCGGTQETVPEDKESGKQQRYQKQGCTPLSLKYNFSPQSAVTAAFPVAVAEFGHQLGYVSVGVSRRGKLCRSVIPHLAQPPADASSVFSEPSTAVKNGSARGPAVWRGAGSQAQTKSTGRSRCSLSLCVSASLFTLLFD